MAVWRKIGVIVVVAVLVGGGWYWWQERQSRAGEQVQYKTVNLQRRDLIDAISATGTIEPEELVDVGAQVGGMVANFGTDVDGKTIDYGSSVKAGMVLARIDDSLYTAELRQCEAQLAQAKANLLSAEAALKQLYAKQELAKSNFARAEQLRPSGAVSQSDYDTSKAELDVAVADIAAGAAAIEQAKAEIASAEAARDRAQRNLGYCTISSPVDGVIIDRQVNVGQTVISSMSAPSLFLIAKDLKRMQIWVAVNEADIGRIQPGQRTVFTVDTFPGETFQGIVSKVRLNASMSQNVVTYVVEVTTDNSSGKLLPYLTASVKFVINERKQVLAVPNAALRLRLGDEEPGNAVWVLDDNGPRRVTVETGLNDGIFTEISGEGLDENTRVITGVSAVETGSEPQSKNPFLPTPPKRR